MGYYLINIYTKLKGENLEGKTYNEIIEEAKDYKKEQELLAEKAKLEEEEKRQRLGSALTVAMYNKGYEKYSSTYSEKHESIPAFKAALSPLLFLKLI